MNRRYESPCIRYQTSSPHNLVPFLGIIRRRPASTPAVNCTYLKGYLFSCAQYRRARQWGSPWGIKGTLCRSYTSSIRIWSTSLNQATVLIPSPRRCNKSRRTARIEGSVPMIATVEGVFHIHKRSSPFLVQHYVLLV